MTPLPSKHITCLFAFVAIFIPSHGLLASDCACSKPEVTFTADTSVLMLKGNGSVMAPPNLATIKIEAVDLPSSTQSGKSPFKAKLERDKTYKVSIEIDAEIEVQCTPELELTFPYCGIKFSTSGLNDSYKEGTSQIITLSQYEDEPMTYSPEYVYVRIPKGDASDDAASNGEPGEGADAGSSPPEFEYDAQAGSPITVPPGFGIEIATGSAMTPQGYQSAGLLVNYGPVQASSAATSAMHWNHISEVTPHVKEHLVKDAQDITTEKHYIVPQGVFRVRGWSFTNQTWVPWANAPETLVEVYDPEQYVESSETNPIPTFTGDPHSYYRIEIATGNNLADGIRLVQSNHGVVHTRSFQASGDGLVLRDVDGNRVTESTVVPPVQNSTSWQRQTTETTDGTVTSSLFENFELAGSYYAPTTSTRDPSAEPNDELTTYTSYYGDGKVKSVSRPDGSWSFSTYSLSINSGTATTTTTTYSPWLSSSSLLYSNGVWSLPSSGMAVKSVSLSDASGSSSQSYLVDLETGNGVQLSGSSSSISTAAGITRTIRSTARGNGNGDLMSYSLAYADDHTERFLAGRTLMTWDLTGRATLHEYEQGTWAGGPCVTASTVTGYIPNPTEDSTTAGFTEVPSHSVKELVITCAEGIVREETHVCTGTSAYEPVVAKDHEYEPAGRRRHTGVKIGGVYLSKTEYDVSPAITRHWSEDGTMTETETNEEGEVVRITTSGTTSVPAVTTTFDTVGLTTTTKVNGRAVSVETRDAAGREVYHKDAIGAVVETTYAAGGNLVTRTAPGGISTIEARHFDGQLLSTTGSGVISRHYTYSVDSGGLVTTTTKIGSETSLRSTSATKNRDGSTAFETSPDPAGGGTPITRTYTYAPNSSSLLRVHSSAANTADTIQLDPAASAAAAMGHYSLSGSETDGNGPVIATGDDRLTEISTAYVLSAGVLNQQTVTRVFHTAGSDAAYSETSLQELAPVAVNHQTYGDGLRWTSSTGNGTTKVTTNRDLFFGWATAVISTDDSATTLSTDSEIISRHGKTVSTSAYGTTHPETMSYDSSGRLIRRTSATGALTVYGYNSIGQLETTMNHEGKTDTYSYYPATHRNAGLLWKTTNPENETTETVYNERGQLEETTGNGAYRVKYEYNSIGERVFMRTYRTAQSAGDPTEWTPDPATGVLTDKTDALGRVTHYTYDSAGRLKTRVWARPGTITTTYDYNAFGVLLSTTYSDGVTPNVGIVPDRLGSPYQITDASGTRTLSYHPVTGGLDLVSYDGTGLLPATELNYDWDTALRPAGYTVSGGGPSAVIGYDDEGRLKTVASAAFTHTHGYIPGTGTLSSLTSTEGSNTVLTRTLYHDRMQRLRGIQTKNDSGTTLSRHGYTLDGAGRRTKATRENGQRWDYGYDPIGQVTSAEKKFPDQAPIPGHTFAFSYDGIGNRLTATEGGTGTVVSYPEEDTNALNQYTKITTEGGRFILGEAPAANEVTINGSIASRAGDLGFYWKQITGDNSTSPLWSNDSVFSNGITISGKAWTPKATVTPAHDLDGNLTYDARWDYTWDAENRLASMTTAESAADAGVPRQRLDFVYDLQGRRISKTVSTSTNGTTWTFASNQRFLYDGWNLIAEYSAPSASSTALTLQATHTWGIDLSGTLQGAGGVGGLLCSTLNTQSSTLNCFPAYDGNGNISAWFEASGILLGRMDYSPYGQLIALYKFTGDTILSRLNFGFSTKFTDAESGWIYYIKRYYDPVTGRWPSRDPMFEITGEHPEFMEEGPNLYGFVHNDSVNGYDFIGLKWRKVGKTKDERRLIWERDDQVKDTMEELAKKVDLDPQEASRWAKPDEKNSCRFTTPNVWIMVKMLHDIHSFRDIYTNPGDEIGDMFTFTGSRKTVNVSSSGAIVSTINSYAGDIIGLSIFGHGDVGIVGGTGGDFEYVNNILSAVDGNGFKLTKAYLMQCYSGAGGYDAAWKARCYKGRAKVYYGVNACGIDFGKKPKPPLR